MSTQAQQGLLLRKIVGHLEQRVNTLWNYATEHPQASLEDLEREAHRLSRDCFALALEAVVQERRLGAEETSHCPCGQVPQYKGEQWRSQETYVGHIQWQRGYFYCPSCARGQYPLDETLKIGPGQFSAGLQAGVCRLGAALPFAQAAETFSALTGVSISAREVERLTEGRGSALEAHQAAQGEQLMHGQKVGGPAEVPAAGGPWAVALDAAKVRFEDGWHDVKAGVVFLAQPQWAEGELVGAEASQQSYVAEVGPMEQAGVRLYGEVVRRGVDPGEELVVCLGDGAPANWSQFALHFPRRVEILDWYHGTEHLWAAGNGVFGQGTLEARGWVAGCEAALWQGDVEAVLAALEHQASQPGGQAAEEELHYFETNRERMRYAQFRAQGYPIGSGTVESACKRVIGARLKQAGMCWTKPGAQAVLSLRSVLLSGRWDEAWQETRLQRKAA